MEENVFIVEDGTEIIVHKAFEDSKYKKIVLPLGLKKIEYCAFWNSGLEEIEIPNTVTTIGNRAFFNCANLRKIKFSGKLKVLSEGLFEECKSLESIEIAEGVEVLEDNCFSDCISLKNVKLPKSLRSIGKCCFSNCFSLESIDWQSESSWISLGAGAFSGCEKLVYVTLPDNIGSVNSGTFEKNTLIKNIPAHIRILQSDLFKDEKYSMIEEFTLPDDVREISSGTFRNFKKLRKIILNKDVKEFKKNAFSGCDSIKEFDVKDNQNFCFKNGLFYSKDGNLIYAVSDGKNIFTVPSYITKFYSSSFHQNLDDIVIHDDVCDVGYSYDYPDNLHDKMKNIVEIVRNRNNMKSLAENAEKEREKAKAEKLKQLEKVAGQALMTIFLQQFENLDFDITVVDKVPKGTLIDIRLQFDKKIKVRLLDGFSENDELKEKVGAIFKELEEKFSSNLELENKLEEVKASFKALKIFCKVE